MRGVMASLRWLRNNIGLSSLPLDSPLLRGSAVEQPERVLRQAVELPLKVWAQYSHLALTASGTLRLMAQLSLYTATVSLRFKHAQRHEFMADLSSGRTLAGRVSKGKVARGLRYMLQGPLASTRGGGRSGRCSHCFRRNLLQRRI